jgi:hypothetical protein
MTQKEMFNGSTGGASKYVRCYETHQPLPITVNAEAGPVTYHINGGSCFSPVAGCDIYIGLDSGMNVKREYPWNQQQDPAQRILFPITDGSVPQDPEDFKRMIDWIAVQLIAGKKVHVGCIGGHGRTGLVLSALVKVMTGEADAITYVRKNYCEKVVESTTQVNFLHSHFGITKADPSKGTYSYHSPVQNPKAGATTANGEWWKDQGRYSQPAKTPYERNKYAPGGSGHHATQQQELKSWPKGPIEAYPTTNPMCIWGPEVRFDLFDKQAKPATIPLSTQAI